MKYELDLVLGTGDGRTLFELKYVRELTEAHRRQAAIYAALEGLPHALLYNLDGGYVETVLAAPVFEVDRLAKSVIALRDGRARANGALAGTSVSVMSPLPGPLGRKAACETPRNPGRPGDP